MRLRAHDIALCVVLAVGCLASVYPQNPTPPPKEQSEAISCTVRETTKDGRRLLECADGTIFLVNTWPAVWDLYRTPGSQVQVRHDGEGLQVIAPTCRERIRKAFFQHADGSLARDSVDKITPDDCKSISKKEREGYTKEP